MRDAYKRIHEKMDYEDGLVLKACDAVNEVFRMYKSWGYGYRVSEGVAVGVVRSLMPKFMIDNPEMFRTPEGMDVKTVERMFLQESSERLGERFQMILHQLAETNLEHEEFLVDFLDAVRSESDATFMARVYLTLLGQDFNFGRYPYLLYEAVIGVLPEMVRYEGAVSAEQYTEFRISCIMAELADIHDGERVYDGACGYGILRKLLQLSLSSFIPSAAPITSR